MREPQVPVVPAEALRDNATSARVERIWQRLESELPEASGRRRTVWWWAPAAAGIVFGSGVFVGMSFSPEPPVAQATLSAEPVELTEAASAPQRSAPVVAARPARPERRARRRPLADPVGVVSRSEQPSEDEGEPAPAPASSSAVVMPQVPEWQRLFNLGEFDAAHRELEAQGGFAAGFDASLATASAEQAVNLADVAAHAGYRGRAVGALRQVLIRYPTDPVAPLAAYKLGNLLEKMGDRAGAVEAFAAYRRLSPTGDLAEDALARQVDVAIERGDLELARQLADQYAQDFPNGRRLSEIREQVLELTDAGAASADSSVEPEEPAEELDEDEADPADDPAAP